MSRKIAYFRPESSIFEKEMRHKIANFHPKSLFFNKKCATKSRIFVKIVDFRRGNEAQNRVCLSIIVDFEMRRFAQKVAKSR